MKYHLTQLHRSVSHVMNKDDEPVTLKKELGYGKDDSMTKSQMKMVGFTLIELMVTLAVLAVLAGIAAPSFMAMIRDNRITTQANNLVGSIQLARSEAAKRGVQITIRHNGATANNWDNGWIVFTDWDADGIYDDNASAPECELEEDCLIRTQAALPNNLTLRTENEFSQWFAFNPSGFPVDLVSDVFSLCSPDGNTANARKIVLNNTGRPSIEKGTSSCP
tara:strand:+ start:67867 stop:68529 length:663 start_codon:yes stop_codon:yes gene_type:complete